MRLLDLFSGAGGAAFGYHLAGFDEIVGVDIKPQKNYPFEFVQGDALDYVLRHGHEFDAIHASPPCQAHSKLGSMYGADYHERHVDLVPATRAALVVTGKPYVIENVPGAPLLNPVMLCGAMFGLKVYRHRLFESNVYMLMPPHPPHKDQSKSAGRGMSPKGFISVTGTGGLGIPDGFRYACSAMGIDWMGRAELSQAIPPAYCKWIGERLMEAIKEPQDTPT